MSEKSITKPVPLGNLDIIVYKGMTVNQLTEAYDDYIADLKKVIMDTVYYPAFLGSFSIKKVAPVLLGDEAGYHHLEVGDGIKAMLNYQEMLNLGSNDPRKWKIKNSLLEYCKQDTLLMAHLHQWLLNK